MPAKRFGAYTLTENIPIIIAIAVADDTAIVVSFFNKNDTSTSISLGMVHNSEVCDNSSGTMVCDVSALNDENWIFDGINLDSKGLFETRSIAVEKDFVLVAKSSSSNVNCTAYGFENQIEEEIL